MTHASLPATLLTFPDAHQQIPPVRAKALVFNDAKSKALLSVAHRIAPSEATVLIVGDTGTGKELLARYIHDHSGRSGAFVALNCSAFSETLVESELFGHEMGAFTGAGKARAGWFEAAAGGTLFLDEIGDMPLAQQAKLLRVLQERQVVRIGSCKPIRVDLRLVAATNVDLLQAVEAGRFRRDLYYRLSVAALTLPPLRERVDDILPLACHFAELYGIKLRRAALAFSADAERALLDYDWPGNIRELENVVHFAAIMCTGAVLGARDLRLPGVGVASPPPLARAIDGLELALQQLLDSEHGPVHEIVQKALITTAFQYSGGNQVRTALRLGVTRSIVRTLLKQSGLHQAGQHQNA